MLHQAKPTNTHVKSAKRALRLRSKENKNLGDFERFLLLLCYTHNETLKNALFEFHRMLAFEYGMNSGGSSPEEHAEPSTLWFCHWNYLFKVHIFNVAYRAWIQWKWQQCIGKKDNTRYHDIETKKTFPTLAFTANYCCCLTTKKLLSAYANWINKHNGANFLAFLCLFQSFSLCKTTLVTKEDLSKNWGYDCLFCHMTEQRKNEVNRPLTQSELFSWGLMFRCVSSFVNASFPDYPPVVYTESKPKKSSYHDDHLLAFSPQSPVVGSGERAVMQCRDFLLEEESWLSSGS